jgi:tetratricopeptide (TPR) repeat protein
MSLKYLLPAVFSDLTTFKKLSNLYTSLALKVVITLFSFHFSLFGDPSVLTAQNIVVTAKSIGTLTWKEHEKLALAAIEAGKNAEAAEHFDAAFLLKPEKLELAEAAANAFRICRDYAKAAERFQNLLNNPKYPHARLDYALALQQKGDFDEAIPEFLMYLNNYNAKDRETVSERIEAHINGCSLGIRQLDSAKMAKVKLEHLDINTADNDIAPVPFGDDVLYFTTIGTGNNAKIFRSQQASANNWVAPMPLKSLQIPDETPFGNGTFSPDGNRFYCTMCQFLDKKRSKTRNCGIYFLKRTRDGWTPPTRLSDRINAPEGNTTHAFVMHKGNKEIMFFSSNRAGGQGGMDIWLTSRFKNDENSEFESPLNLGAIVNTEGDEVTPFYDADATALYFASNGRATIGGLDIFRSEGFQQRWTSPANLGAPYNSSADDYYFAKNSSKTGGFLVSNRSLGMEKIGTRDDDIYQFLFDDRNELTVSGQIFDKKTVSLLENARTSLYEKRASSMGDGRLLASVMSPTGAFSFPLLPKKSYTLEVEKDGFRIETVAFSTLDTGKTVLKNIIRDFYLERYATLASLEVKSEKAEGKSESKTAQKAENTEESSKVKNEKLKVKSEEPEVKNEKSEVKNESKTAQKAENTEGSSGIKNEKLKIKEVEKTDSKVKSDVKIQFKVQVLAYEIGLKDNLNVKKLERVEDLGDFETETATINGKTFKRVLLSCDSYAAAVSTLQKVKDRSLTDAFLIRYEDGKRTNKSK